jgi:hypothetical protein
VPHQVRRQRQARPPQEFPGVADLPEVMIVPNSGGL